MVVRKTAGEHSENKDNWQDSMAISWGDPRAAGRTYGVRKVEREYTLEQVVRAVCDHYRISPEKMRAPGKGRPMAEARGVAAAIVQESSRLRLIDLAKLLKRDDSALAKAAQRLKVAHIVREIITGLEANKGKTKPINIQMSILTP